MSLLDQSFGQLARDIPGVTTMYLGLKTLKNDLMNHIHLENNILFDRIDGQLEEVRHG